MKKIIRTLLTQNHLRPEIVLDEDIPNGGKYNWVHFYWDESYYDKIGFTKYENLENFQTELNKQFIKEKIGTIIEWGQSDGHLFFYYTPGI